MNTQINDGGQQMSTTPRTDAVQFLDQSDYHDPSAVDWFVRADCARTLETELAAEREKVRVLREALELITNQADACQGFCDTFTPSSRIKARVALHVTKEASK